MSKDPLWLIEALHASGTIVAIRGRFLQEGNKPLANVGDGVAKVILRERFYDAGFGSGE